jgi:hypothetical protein
MDHRAPAADRSRKTLIWSIALIALIVVAIGGGVALIINATTGGGSGKKVTPVAATTAGPRNPTAGQTVLAGNVTPSYPTGDAGQIAVVALGPITYSSAGGTLPIAVRNNTAAAVSRIAITGVAEDAAGTKLATASSQQQVEPAQLAPGQLGYSFVHFDPSAPQVPPNSAYQFTITSNPADTSAANTASVKVNTASPSGGSIVGTATNTTGARLQGPYSVQAFCFDAQGNLNSAEAMTTDQIGDIPAGGTVNYTIPLHGSSCSNYLVGISGLYT